MVKKMARLTFIAACFCVWPRLIVAQGPMIRIHSGIDQVPGVEFVAAVNITKKNVKAAGTIFVPDNARRVRAVIVLTERCPRCDLGAGGRFGDPAWRRLSQTCECALLYLRLDTIRAIDANTPVANDVLRNAAVGGADALLLLLQRIGEESARRELKDAPMLFWGWSQAASFGTTFAELYPERTVAFIRYHTHLRGLPAEMKVLRNIPALLIAGGKDETAGTEDAETFWKRGRSAGAPWTFAIEPDATHGSSEEIFDQSAHEFLIPWMAAVVRQRVAPGTPRLRPVADDSGWLGNNQTAEIAPHATLPGPKVEASWLPDEVTARGWRAVLHVAK